MTDNRKRCRAEPPFGKVPKAVTVHLSPEDYRHLYMVTMARGTSMAEALRQIIREARE